MHLLRLLNFCHGFAGGSAEEEIERRFQLALQFEVAGLVSFVDQDLGEEGFIELAFEMLGRVAVDLAAVLGQIQGDGDDLLGFLGRRPDRVRAGTSF